MFNRPSCRSRRGGFLLGIPQTIKETRHDIEAALPGSASLLGIRAEPGVSATTESALFACVYGFRSQTMTLEKVTVRSRFEPGRVSSASTLHFDKHQGGTASDDQVDLDAIRADVARDDAIPSCFEE
jgi:hypothetical protein